MADFKQEVYNVVRRIPRGRVLTYREVARRAGSPLAWRAVGNILNKNRDPKVPCHRVIRSDGSVGGYSRGAGKKAELLKKEKAAGRIRRRTRRTTSSFFLKIGRGISAAKNKE